MYSHRPNFSFRVYVTGLAIGILASWAAVVGQYRSPSSPAWPGGKVLLGHQAKIDTNLRWAKSLVENTLRLRGPGAAVEALSLPKIRHTRADGSIQVYVWLSVFGPSQLSALSAQGVVFEATEPSRMKVVHCLSSGV